MDDQGETSAAFTAASALSFLIRLRLVRDDASEQAASRKARRLS
jgi:hypothetical protein